MDGRDAHSNSGLPAHAPIPPHSIEAEMAMLGSMLIDRDAIGAILPIIAKDEFRWFYKHDHQELFKTLVDMYDANSEIDLVTSRDELLRRGSLDKVGGVEYLVSLAESVPSAANADHYARIVRDKGLLRDMIQCTGEISKLAFGDNQPATDLIDEAEQKFFKVTERRITRHASQLKDLVTTLYNQIQQGHDKYITGVPTGFTELDDLTCGFQPGDFIIVAGRPSMGKTALGLTMAEYASANEQQPVIFFSMEMGNQQIAQRILCSRGRIDSHRFRKGMLTEEDKYQLGVVCDELANAPFLVDDTPGMSILELRAKVRRLVRQHDIKAIFVDYIQLMHAPGCDSRQQEISVISRGLKAIGRELNIPVIAMAQLNRQAEGRQGNRPRMADLRESGALEQDADVILLIHREEYYNPEKIDHQGIAEIIIAKQRNGPTDTVKVQFNKQLTRFDNLSTAPVPHEYTPSGDDTPF